jgi:4'-phosphopantetheinyl transferase
MTAEPCSWASPPARLQLDGGAVHVWRFPLDPDAECLERLRAILSADEQARAARYRFAKDQDAFVAARGRLRSILGLYLDREPAALRFEYNVQGKPSLPAELSDDRLRFNLTHSHNLALCAVACRRELGIDLEHHRPELAGETIAERFFSAREVATLRALPPSLQQVAFFACWTRKEAYMKAVGGGLTIPLDQVEVTLHPEEAPALLSTLDGPSDAARWCLRALAPGPGYTAALVVEGHGWQLHCWDWVEPAVQEAP